LLGEDGHPSLMPSFEGSSGTKFGHKKLDTLYAIVRWKPGVSISAGLESAPGRDRHQDRHNYDSI